MFTWMEITQFPKHKTLMISLGNYTFTSTFSFVYMHHELQYTNQSQYLWQCNTVVYFFWLVSTISICVTSRVFIYSVSFAARKAYVGSGRPRVPTSVTVSKLVVFIELYPFSKGRNFQVHCCKLKVEKVGEKCVAEITCDTALRKSLA